ncbi:hypothetical protein [Rhodopirellula sp. P2]|uniref:hypothetical protein n=1 Tax=Rhodopirellula sp. P2 TaxID=2127060 RepID=UPI002368336C|nr:hypothetical protein [Rhodopirellula sp. P2]WDQ17616.1 hypothetical protein PSR62_03460 [Rhodopirellula sp. P2]
MKSVLDRSLVGMFLVLAPLAPCFLTGCSSSEPAVVEEAVMSDTDMEAYEAEMDATDPIEK